MKKILLIVPYFGKWPVWFDVYLLSIAGNPTVHWLCPTDCKIPIEHPKNITFIPTTLLKLNNHINKVVEVEVPLSPRKLCDLKLAYAEIFSKQVQEFDFWGICDMDIVWGNIRSFVSHEDLDKYDIISSRKYNTSGHFTIFKNKNEINSLYKSIPNFKKKLGMPKNKRMDEDGLTRYLWKKINDPSKDSPKIKWNSILCNQEKGRDSHQEYYLDKWLWKDGKMLELKNGEPINEVMYLHFINWKRTMKYCEVAYADAPEQFYISYTGMHYKPHSGFAKALNGFKNLFDGYWINERIRIKKSKFKRFKKTVRNKLKQ